MEKIVEEKLDAFFAQFRTVSFEKGETILNVSDPIDYIYYLKQGFVKQSFITEDGEEITHHIFKPISYFPIMLVLSDMPNRYIFTAMEPITVHKAPTDKVLTFLEKEPDVLFDLTKRFAQGLSKLLLKNEQMLFKDAYTKVASLLFYLSGRFGQQSGGKSTIAIPLTHTDIASWLGMQRETVSRQIEKLQKKQIVTYTNNVLTILDKEALEQEFVRAE